MWRRIVCSHLKTLAADVTVVSPSPLIVVAARSVDSYLATNRLVISTSSCVISRHFNSESVENLTKKKVEDVMPIATRHEREEFEAELEGRRLLDIDFPEGPFGTKEASAIVKSYYDKELWYALVVKADEHDVVWFWLEKGKSFECPICTQYFELEMVGPCGPPDGHGLSRWISIEALDRMMM